MNLDGVKHWTGKREPGISPVQDAEETALPQTWGPGQGELQCIASG